MPKDVDEALKLYRKAAEQNSAQAQYDLGLCYANGEGVTKNYVEAYKWWTLSANQNNAPARKYLSILQDRMSREQIADGQRLVSNFRPQITSTEWIDRSTPPSR